MRLKKCGEFMEKDGVVVKRPGKRFICPKAMPAKMRMFYPLNGELTSAQMDDIGEMNALKEQQWRQAIKEEYKAMKRLYYFQECVRFVRRTCHKILNIISANSGKETYHSRVHPEVYASIMGSKNRQRL